MNIKDLCKLSHKMAVEKGFWGDCVNCKGTRKELKQHGCQSCSSYTVGSKLRRNTSELLMLIVTELGEACEALRKSNRQKKGSFTDIYWVKDTFEDEIADVFIRLGDMCEALGIDIEWQIKEKMKYNKGRPKKHGKAF